VAAEINPFYCIINRHGYEITFSLILRLQTPRPWLMAVDRDAIPTATGDLRRGPKEQVAQNSREMATRDYSPAHPLPDDATSQLRGGRYCTY